MREHPVRLAEVIGHRRTVAWLRRALARGVGAGAYLFYGPPGVGKGTVARAFAAALVCRSRGEDQEACGRCADCRKAAADRHPDITWVAPETQAGNLSIDQIRQLRALLHLSPGATGWKVAILRRADRMTPQAANALLKTLEEPLGLTLLLLLADELAPVPETVRSRCLRFYFPPVPVRQLAAALQARLGLAPEEAGARAALAGGCPGRALARADRDGECRLAALQWLQRAAGAAAVEVDRMAREADGADLAQVDETLCAMIWLWRDVAAWSWTRRPDSMVNQDLRQELAPLGERLAPERAAPALEALLTARRMLSEYTSRRLTLDWAWMSLRSALTSPPAPPRPGPSG